MASFSCGMRRKARKSGTRRKIRSHSSGGRSRGKKRCMKSGRVTNNGYLNFLRDFRKCCCGMSPQKTIQEGAKKWNSLSKKEREKYNRAARKVQKHKSMCQII